MQIKTKIGTAFAALVILAAGSGAGAAPPPPETKDLARLVGSWKGTGSMAIGSDKADGIKVTWTCRAVSGGSGVACDAVMTGIPGVDRYEETDLFGYDPGTGKLHWFAVTNAGETHDHVGGPWNGQSAQFVYTGVQDRKPLKEILDLSFKGGSVDIHAQTFLDGKLASVLHATARK
ncbi:MAG: DUF1579 family protein [Polyangia bacterium]